MIREFLTGLADLFRGIWREMNAAPVAAPPSDDTPLEIKQIHRDHASALAAKTIDSIELAVDIRQGRRDWDAMVQAFARFDREVR